MEVSNLLEYIEGILDNDVSYLKFEFDEQKNTIDMTIVPKVSLEYIDMKFTVTKDGVEFNQCEEKMTNDKD